jgi:hypothetical protein
VEVSGVLHFGELPGVHRRRAEIEIDVVGVEASQRGVDLLHDRHAGQPGAAGAIVHLPGDLRGAPPAMVVGTCPPNSAASVHAPLE